MLKKVMMILLPLFLLILLNGCSSKEIVTKIEYVKQDIPLQLLDCKDLPKVNNMTMQSEVALYIIDLYDTATDCKTKLNEIKELLK